MNQLYRIFNGSLKNYKKQISLVLNLYREVGIKKIILLISLKLGNVILDLLGIGFFIIILFNSPSILGFEINNNLSLSNSFSVLIFLISIRSLIKYIIVINQDLIQAFLRDRLRKDLLSNILYSSTSELNKVSRGDLTGLILNNINLTVKALNFSFIFIQALISLLIYAFFILLNNKISTYALIIGLGLSFLIALLQKSNIWKLGLKNIDLSSTLYKTVGDGMHGIKSIKSAYAEDWVINKFIEETKNFRKVWHESLKISTFYESIRDLVIYLFLGLWILIFRKDFSNVEIVSTLVLVWRSSIFVTSLIYSQRMLSFNITSYSKLLSVRRKLSQNNLDLFSQNKKYDEIKFLKNRFKKLVWINNNLEKLPKKLTLEKGKLILILGKSGIGKTTLLDNLVGILNAKSAKWELILNGSIEFLDCENYNYYFRNLIGYCPQKTTLFETNLLNNLLLGSEDFQITDQKIKDIELLFSELSLEKYLKYLYNRSFNLNLTNEGFSSGEILRFGLIRTIMQNKVIEIFDEPTASLDYQTANLVKNLLFRRVSGKAILIVSHDRDLFSDADTIIDLEKYNI